MSRPITWHRVYRGKVWHLSFETDRFAVCGAPRPTDSEVVGEHPPANARVCGDCVSTALHLYSLAQAAQMADPRKTFDPWAAGEAVIATEALVLDCPTCGHASEDHDDRGCSHPDGCLLHWVG